MIRSVSFKLVNRRAFKLLSTASAITDVALNERASYHVTCFVKNFMVQAIFYRSFFTSVPRFSEKIEDGKSSNTARLDRLFSLAHQNIVNYGRLSLDDVVSLIKQTKVAESFLGAISYTQSLFLIRCTGSVLPEASTKVKSKLLDEVLEMLKSLNVHFDTMHYNYILAVYLENEVTYNPFVFLAKVERSNILPNKVTFQKILSSLCQRGDLGAVKEILNMMKGNHIAIDNKIFNAIVMGHSRNGDWQNAEKTIEAISNAGFEPDSRTYTALLEGYAKHGCREELALVIDQCKTKDVSIRDRDLLDISYVAAVNGHLSILDYLLTIARKDWGYNRSCVNLVFRLVCQKQEDAAFKILLSMKPIFSKDGRPLPSGNFFIRHLVRCGCAPEKIIKFCRELVTSRKNSKAFFKALEAAALYNDTVLTSQIMHKLQGNRSSAKPHLYGPLLSSRARTSGEEGVLKLLREMKCMGTYATVEVVIRCLLPHLTGDVRTVLQKLLDAGISFYVSAVSLLRHSIECHDFNSAIWLASNYYTGLDIKLRDAMIKAYLESKDAVSLGKLIRALLPLPREIDEDDDLQDSSNQLIDSILRELCNQTPSSDVLIILHPLLEALNEHGLSISVNSSQHLREVVGERMSSSMDGVLNLLESNKFLAVSTEYNDRLNVGSEFAVKSVKEFNECARSRDIDAVLKCKEMLDAKNVPLSDGMNVSLMMTYVKNGSLDEALAMFTELVKNDTKIFLPNLVTLSAQLLKNNRIEDTFYVLNYLNQAQAVEALFSEDHVRTSIARMLNIAASQGNVELTRKLFEKFKEKAKIDRKVLSPLIKAHLVRGDFDGALNEFKHCVTEYHCTPGKIDLLEKLVENNDQARINAVIEAGNKVDGEKNSLHDLAFAYLRRGSLEKAQSIFQTPGLRALNKRLDDVCRYNCATRRVQEIEDLLKTTKHLFNIDRLMLYNHMLTAYINTDQPLRARELWSQLQEENEVTPDDNFMLRLGNFLMSRNCTVPFAMPPTVSTAAQVTDCVSTLNV